jgi:biotin carboxyl carrier protein
MPGAVLSVKAAVGDSVKKGQVLLVLEAMKMENEVVSPSDGAVVFAVAPGTHVNTGDVLVVLK